MRLKGCNSLFFLTKKEMKKRKKRKKRKEGRKSGQTFFLLVVEAVWTLFSQDFSRNNAALTIASRWLFFSSSVKIFISFFLLLELNGILKDRNDEFDVEFDEFDELEVEFEEFDCEFDEFEVEFDEFVAIIGIRTNFKVIGRSKQLKTSIKSL